MLHAGVYTWVVLVVQAAYARRCMYTWVATVVRKGEFLRNTISKKFARPSPPARPCSGAERVGALDWWLHYLSKLVPRGFHGYTI